MEQTRKTCTMCFFKGFSPQDPKAPCFSCVGHNKFVTDSDDFWKDITVARGAQGPWPFPSTQEQAAQCKSDAGQQTTKPLDVQVGGGHYKTLAIQPIEYIHANKLNYCEANIVKYITRWREKGGKQDLEKVKHYVDLLIQLEKL